jgi:hypothetical protein
MSSQFPSLQSSTANKPLSPAQIIGVSNGAKAGNGVNSEHLTNVSKSNGLSITSLPPGSANTFASLNQRSTNGKHSNISNGM